MTTPNNIPGHVIFVGAGPGDPGLLTLRAVDVLAEADAIVIDHECQQELLAHAKDDVEIIDVGSDGDGYPLTAAVRGRKIVSASKGGRRVVRLLDGDPFTHPTGADEALACAKGGVPFEIVPGVSNLTAVPSHAGIPLVAGRRRGVAIVDVNGKIDWKKHTADTLVLLRAGEQLEDVATSLIEAGRAADLPAAAITSGTTVQ